MQTLQIVLKLCKWCLNIDGFLQKYAWLLENMHDFWEKMHGFWENMHGIWENMHGFWENMHDFWENMHDFSGAGPGRVSGVKTRLPQCPPQKGG